MKGEKRGDQPQKITIAVEQIDSKLKIYQGNSFVVFHLIMLVTSVYISMLITNWGSPRVDADSSNAYQPTKLSFWVKISLSWVTALLYTWTLIAPKLFPQRSF